MATQPSGFSFSGLRAAFLPTGFAKKRLEILRSSFAAHGGLILDIDTFHRSLRLSDVEVCVIVSECLDTAIVRKQLEQRRIIATSEQSDDQEVRARLVVLKATWISVCLEKRLVVENSPYRMMFVVKRKANSSLETSPAKIQVSPVKTEVLPVKFSRAIDPEKFACAHASSNARTNHNEKVVAEMEKMLEVYRSRKDTWRVVSYEKVINLIKSLPYELTTWEEARSLRGVGDNLADKIWEIIESGKLRKAEELGASERVRVVSLFSGIWGVGPTVADQWYNRGWRTLDDVHRAVDALTHQQKVGLKHYDDFNSRIPRAEAAEVEATVRVAAMDLCDQPVVVQACGSYRRKKETCGDVDVLVSYPGLASHEPIFGPLLDALRRSGFLTDDLAVQDPNGSQRKYLGVCRLPGDGRKFRRIDIIVAPWAEYAPALMYFTGSAHFTRSMRLLAMKMGMSLNEHGLRAGVRRVGREKVWEGQLLETPTEESIFSHLGLKYRPPEERDH